MIDISELLVEHMEKRMELSEMMEDKTIHDHSHFELQVINCIAENEHPNVTCIAERTGFSKGAVSKITKRLLNQRLIEMYKLGDNNQKLYFKLTNEGLELYRLSIENIEEWKSRDCEFYRKYTDSQLNLIADFFGAYNDYLDSLISQVGEEK